MNNILSKPYFVSVIIPVFNDSQRLKKCLEALEHQSYPQDFYEIIVIDNNSTEEIKTVVEKFSQVLLGFEPVAGSYLARNKGISLAKGEIIAFTDADCIPATNWIETGVKKLLTVENCGLVAGKIEFYFQNPDSINAVEFYDSIIFLNQQKYIEQHFGVTANLFTFAHVFQTVGLFNPSLKSSGDRDWGNRVFAQGYQQIYADDVCVQHPAINSFKKLCKKLIRLTGGDYDYKKQKNHQTWLDILPEIAKDLKPPVKFIQWRIADPRLKNNRQKAVFIFIVLFAKYLTVYEKIRLKIGGISTRA